MGARPVLGHGPHRYHYQVVALDTSLDSSLLSKETTKEEVIEMIDGKVLGWGQWVGIYERKMS